MADWPHRNSDFVIASTIDWVKRFGEWPRWLSFPDQVAAELIKCGALTRSRLREVGYRPSAER